MTIREWVESQKNWCDHGQVWTNENIHNFARAVAEFVVGEIVPKEYVDENQTGDIYDSGFEDGHGSCRIRVLEKVAALGLSAKEAGR